MKFSKSQLKQIIKEEILIVLGEGHYHDMGGEDEMYDVMDPHGFKDMADDELISMMRTNGMEEMIVLDGEGGLANREEVIAALKDVESSEAPPNMSSMSWEEKAALMADR